MKKRTRWSILDHRFTPVIEQEITDIIYACPYCGKQIDEQGACCGEIGHAEKNFVTKDQYYSIYELDRSPYLELVEEFEK